VFALVIGECALSQEGICGDDFAFDIDGIKERDCHFDLVSALGFFIALFGQSACFFWV